jgi:hypothetical protein
MYSTEENMQEYETLLVRKSAQNVQYRDTNPIAHQEQ